MAGKVFPSLFPAIAGHRLKDTLPGLELEGKLNINVVTAGREETLMGTSVKQGRIS
jgi:hypothetical protein